MRIPRSILKTTGHWLPLALTVVSLTTGCRSGSEPRKPEPPQILDAGTGVQNGGNSGVVKSEFRGKMDDKDQVSLRLELARNHELRGDTQAAVNEYARAIEVADKGGGRKGSRATAEQKALAHRRMAAAMDRSGRFTQAEVHYKTALKLSPNDPRIWNDAGYSSYLQGNWAEAERRLRAAEKIAPEEPRVQTNLGLALAAAGRTDDALTAFSSAGGGPAIGHANLAYILAAMGKTDDARRHYEIALKFQPALEPARLALVQLDIQARAPRTEQIASAPPALLQDASISRTGSGQAASAP